MFDLLRSLLVDVLNAQQTLVNLQEEGRRNRYR